ncbi:MAG: hypothetical protein KJ906_01120 [Nanoarchaeota archaeon]|nr:hypothetical protein [Nanoarchaeota archaeon]
MKKEKKKQLIALFILLMFGGSTLAIALSSAVPPEVSQKLIFDEPLAESDEAYFFKQNMVVVRVYYDDQSDTIDILNNMINTLNQKMMLERIYIPQYPNEYSLVEDKFFTKEMPMILIRGRQEVYLNGEQDGSELLDEICGLYFEEIEECLSI